MNAYLTVPRLKKRNRNGSNNNNNNNNNNNTVKINLNNISNTRPISALLAETTKFKEIERNLRYTPFFSNELHNLIETAPELLKRA